MFQTIKNYDEIEILPNSIIMIDIDNTIIKFGKLYKNWWKDNEPNALEGWLKIIKEEKPEILDENEFTKLLNEVKNTNSEIIYITARDEELRELTNKHLIDCGILTTEIYHAYPKGKKIIEIYKEKSRTKQIQNIIFIDDQYYNIEDAEIYLSKYLEYSNSIVQVKYYLMNHQNLN